MGFTDLRLHTDGTGEKSSDLDDRHKPLLTSRARCAYAAGRFRDCPHGDADLDTKLSWSATALSRQTFHVPVPLITSNDRTATGYTRSITEEVAIQNIPARSIRSPTSTTYTKHTVNRLATKQLLDSLLIQEAQIQCLQILCQQVNQRNKKSIDYKTFICKGVADFVQQKQNLKLQQQINRGLPICPQKILNSYKQSFACATANSKPNGPFSKPLHDDIHTIHDQPAAVTPSGTLLQIPTNSMFWPEMNSQQQSNNNKTCFQDDDTKPKGRPSVFPQKLHQILSDLAKISGGTEIASFLPNGRAFVIHRPQQFIKKVIPKYFALTSIASFERQLRMYGFHQISTGPDKGAYFHKLFIQSQPALCLVMKRVNDTKHVK